MKYPIDPEWYIQALKKIFGHIGEGQDTLYRSVIPLVNTYYERGKSGKNYDLPDTDDGIRAEFRCNLGEDPNPQVLEILSRMLVWCRDAYEQGRQEAA